ncbi:DUF6798 domain-containing protein [Reyranella sp.]|uniref:DUF6798 domain-containing protein n=1 Tax=Reyranella sp. TaxID=1929291 RepID=UPI003D0B8144
MTTSTARRTWILLAGAVGIAAVVSVAQQRFVFGYDNNVFHIPIVLRWADEPVFANDHVVQSMKNFTAPFWLLVRFVTNETNVEWVFYLFHVAIRAASLAALTWAAANLGVRGLLASVLLPFWFAVVPGLRWETPIGAAQVFNITLSHSDLVPSVALVGITLAAQKRYLSAFSTLGAMANINAFAAAWVGCALMGVASGDRSRKTVVRSAVGLAVAAALALPLAVWIFGVIQEHPVSGAQRERFLWEYFPNHSLLLESDLTRVILLGAIALVGLIGFRLVAQAGEPWARALVALCLLIVAGMLLPNLIVSRFLLDLHLLRAAGLVQLLAVVALTAAAISSLRSSDVAERVGGLLALCLLALPALQGMLFSGAVLFRAKREDFLLPVVLTILVVFVTATTAPIWPTPVLFTVEIGATAAYFVLKPHMTRWGAPPLNASVAMVALIVAGVALYTYRVHRTAIETPERRDALRVIAWAQANTPPDSVFLVPLRSNFIPDFQSRAHRQIWVDWKRGGSVMWAPIYYQEWSRRMKEVGDLQDLPAKLAYACQNGINYVLTGIDAGNGDLSRKPVYGNDHFQMFDARRWCDQVK